MRAQPTARSQELGESTCRFYELGDVPMMVPRNILPFQVSVKYYQKCARTIPFARVGAIFPHSKPKNSPVDWLDGGKLFVESCLAVIAILAALRYRHAAKRSET